VPKLQEVAVTKPEERIIVALDVPTAREALSLVEELHGLVSFYKVGLELLLAGGLENLLVRLARESKVFVDLKLPNDIPETVRRAVAVATRAGVTFLTLSHSATRQTLQSAIAGRGGSVHPELLFVPVLSSMDGADFARTTGQPASQFGDDLVRRAKIAEGDGADGFIISGPEIALMRAAFPRAILVSPGIRPAGAATEDHKRSCTPAEAIHLGADYIVVGRPIRNAAHRRDAAKRIIEEIARARG
jgi:orotidine-5'-phosphate decarboxylase